MGFDNIFIVFLLPSLVISQCNYQQTIDTGSVYYVQSPNYPNNYPRPTQCYWNAAATWTDNQILLDCTNFDVYNSVGCQVDRMLVDPSGTYNWDQAYYYCGKGNFSVYSTQSHMNIYFGASSENISTTRGFSCSITAVRKNGCQCGWKKQNRIVGGEPTLNDEFPWMAGVLKKENGWMIYCGGTIISATYVLTAAHCLLNLNEEITAIVFGEHDLVEGKVTNLNQIRRVSKLISHPNYDQQTQANDIALVRTATTIPFSTRVGPACLPYIVPNLNGQEVTIMGWGSEYFTGAPSDELLKANVNVLSLSACQSQYPRDNITESQICTYGHNKDTCQFDSGGPLIWFDSNNQRYKVVGVVSYGIGCGSEKPGVNTRVTKYLGWIQTTTANSYCYV